MQFWALIACLPDVLAEENSRLRFWGPLGLWAESWAYCRRKIYRMLQGFHHLTLLAAPAHRPTCDE